MSGEQANSGSSGELEAPAAGSLREVLLLAEAGKEGVGELLDELPDWLRGRGLQVRVEEDARAFCEARETSLGAEVDGTDPDLVIVVGGDGSMLGVVRALRDRPVPTFGINFGRVGFLASTPATRWAEVLEQVLDGRGVLEPRMRLAVEVLAGGERHEGIALNDVVLQRSSTQGMLTVSLWVGRDWVTDYRSDGVVLATPTGSTAYSLSAGGPVLAPSMGGIVATPLCTQALSHRPIVLHPDSELTLVLESGRGEARLVLDGQTDLSLSPGDRVHLSRHPLPWPLLSMPGLDPYRRLRSRLGWGGEVRGGLPSTRRQREAREGDHPGGSGPAG